MFVVLCINLYATRVVLSNLGVEDYGIYNVVCGFVSLFMFLNASLTNGIQRFYSFELGRSGEKVLGKVYSSALLIQAFVIAIILLLTETLGIWYLNDKMVIPLDRMMTARHIYQLSVLSFVMVILQSPYSAAVLAFEKMDYYAVVSVVMTVLKLLAALSLPYMGNDRLLDYGILLALSSLIEFLLYYIFVKARFRTMKLSRLNDLSLLKSMSAFSGWNILGAFSNIMKEQGVNLILNLFCGPVVNAARAIAVQVSGGLQAFVNNLAIPVRPQVIKSYAAGDMDRTMKLTYAISKASCYLLYIIALPVISEIDFILDFWIGENVPEYTSSFVMIMILTSFVSNLNAAVSGVVHASGKMKAYQLSTSMVSLSSIPLAYLVLRGSGNPDLALLVVFFIMMLVQAVSLWILKGIVRFSISGYLKEVIKPLLTVVASTFYIPVLIHCFMDAGWLRLGFSILISMPLVGLAIYLWGLNESERDIIRQFIKRKNGRK